MNRIDQRARCRRYNSHVHARWLVFVVIAGGALLAQSAAPNCPANRPVDDFIAEIHKAKSKKNSRTKNPLPDYICVFGWCKGTAKRPPMPRPSPQEHVPETTTDAQSSSSRPAKCDEEMEQSLDAAHDVDVGDTYFEEQKFQAALYRYQDADKKKPDDAAIEVRLGRANEKLNQPAQAIEQYSAAAKLPGPEKWTREAHDALSRLQSSH